MWFIVGAYAIPPILAYYFLWWFVLSATNEQVVVKVKLRTVMFFTFMGLLSFICATVAGYALSFFFESPAYWHSMTWDFTFWNNHGPDSYHGDAFGGWTFILAPYTFAINIIYLVLYNTATHLNWSFAITYSIFVFTVFNWIRANIYANNLRDPRKVFGHK